MADISTQKHVSVTIFCKMKKRSLIIHVVGITHFMRKCHVDHYYLNHTYEISVKIINNHI
jgi:hypothetical protein